MFTNHAVRPGRAAARSRLFNAGAVVAACAVAGALTAGGNALASSVASRPAAQATSSAIKACYQKNVSLPVVKHIAASAACPSGYSSLTWNQQGPAGPQGATGAKGATGATGKTGPAGLSVGVSVSAPTQVVLDHAQDLSPVMAAQAVPQSGDYFVNASVQLLINTGDLVACILGQGGADQDEYATAGPFPTQSYATIPLTGLMQLSAGQQPTVYCTDYNSDSATEFYDGDMTATLMNTVSGDTTRLGPVSRRDLHLPPFPKHS